MPLYVKVGGSLYLVQGTFVIDEDEVFPVSGGGDAYAIMGNPGGDSVQLFTVDLADGVFTAVGSAQSVATDGSGMGLVWFNGVLYGMTVSSSDDRTQLYTVDPADGALTAVGSAQGLAVLLGGANGVIGAGLTLLNGSIYALLVDFQTDRLWLLTVDHTDGTIATAGPGATPNNFTSSGGVATLNDLIYAVVWSAGNFDSSQLYSVSTSGVFTPIGSPQDIGGSGPNEGVRGVGLTVSNGVIYALVMYFVVTTLSAQLFTVDPADGVFTAVGSAQSVATGVSSVGLAA